jgi:hypothetical protein
LASNSSDLARSVDPWIAGFARQDRVVIFPSRSPRYPDNTLDDVVRHEIAHVLIWRAAEGRPIPRWFNEGLATAAERRLGFQDQTRLFFLIAAGSRLRLDEIDRLFRGGESDQTRAYLLSAALVQRMLNDSGKDAGGRILQLIGSGVSFERAFAEVTDRSTSDLEDAFWARGRVWTAWIPILSSPETLWLGIAVLALLAIWRHRKRNAEMRRRWEEEESGLPNEPAESRASSDDDLN